MAAVNVSGHAIDVSVNRLTGKEHVTYDGQDVSSERNLGHATHEFTVEEDGRQVAYSVVTSNEVVKGEVSSVSRDGETVYPAA